jgi:hypothetical protein
MITRETIISFEHYKVHFRVFNDEQWLVTIDNMEDEFGATGNECHNNWNKGLASAFVEYAKMTNDEEAQNLMYQLVMNENIENEFVKHLPSPYSSPCYGCPFQKDCNSTPSVCVGG